MQLCDRGSGATIKTQPHEKNQLWYIFDSRWASCLKCAPNPGGCM